MITTIFNILHFIFLFIPVLIYFIKIGIVERYMKWIFLLIALTPLHWVFFEDKCISTILSKKFGDYQDSETTSQFSENYMGWLYKPIMELIGLYNHFKYFSEKVDSVSVCWKSLPYFFVNKVKIQLSSK